MYRDDPKRNRLVTLHALSDPQHNKYCPIKLILALSLRLGNVNGTSIEDILIKANQRQDKTIVWSRPDQPLLVCLNAQGTHLLDKPAPKKAISTTVTKAGQLAGILGHLQSQHLRFGAAYDIANLKEEPTGFATIAVARSLGHSTKAFEKGVTDEYVGSTYHDHWSSRVKESIESPRFDLEIAPAAYVKSRLSAAKLDELCDQKNLNRSDKNIRQSVKRAYHRDHYDMWVLAGLNAESNPQALSRKRSHAVAVGNDQPTIPPISSPKKTRLDDPLSTNMHDHDGLDGKTVNTSLPDDELTTSI